MRHFLFLTLFFFSIVSLRAAELVLTGNYYGNNLVVLNPSVGDGFCVTEVKVNGIQTKDEIRSNSFEIDFTLLEIKIGDPVKVVIQYHDGCKPKIINPQALIAGQNFSFNTVKIDRSGKLTWNVNGTLGDDPFIVEQFRWNNWNQVAEIAVTDTLKPGLYGFDISPHSGLNQFRVVHTDANGNPVYSKIAKYNNTKVTFVDLGSTRVTDKIIFSAETIYELFDSKGNYIIGGFGKEVDVTEIDKGKYFLNYDIKSVTITKK
jgi:hypothetical protein